MSPSERSGLPSEAGRRIVSLVPSATEILCAIGGAEMLAGRSHECDYPGGIAGVAVVTGQTTLGGTPAEIDRQVREQLNSGKSLYSLDAGLLESLQPDVILTQDLCSVCSIDEAAVRGMVARWRHPPRIVSLNPASIEGILDSVLVIGEASGLVSEATSLAIGLRERLFAAQDHANPYADGPEVVFLEWTDPLFVGGHWIPQMIERAGGRHPLNPTRAAAGSGAAAGPQQASRLAGKSVAVSPDRVVSADPDFVVVCPCGVGLSDGARMVEELAEKGWFRDLRAVRAGRVAVVDGNQMFSRPGPRVADAMEWLVRWMHGLPGVIPGGFPWLAWPAARASAGDDAVFRGG